MNTSIEALPIELIKAIEARYGKSATIMRMDDNDIRIKTVSIYTQEVFAIDQAGWYESFIELSYPDKFILIGISKRGIGSLRLRADYMSSVAASLRNLASKQEEEKERMN